MADTGTRLDRLTGTLLGTALGDALGLPAEGMSAGAIARRFGAIDRFRLIGRTGFVSDDTEQAALVAQSLIHWPEDVDACTRAFRRSLLGWFARLPFGIGRATVRACVRIALGIKPSGVRSAGNGAAMRAAIVGAFFADHPEARLAFGRALASTTHLDVRAVEGALYVAEVAAESVRQPTDASPLAVIDQARRVVTDPQLGEALDLARELANTSATFEEAALQCRTTGFVVHTCAFATFAFLRQDLDVLSTLSRTISCGGDTDSIAAILGGWLGARRGASALPSDLVDRIDDGPFGPTHLRALAGALDQLARGEPAAVPRYSKIHAFSRNLFVLAVVLGHGFRRLVPF
jgi:ADP-ribosyl-[dinitrogen reductase] hydrolase